MAIRRIGWQGATRARRLLGHLEQGLTRWQQGWFSDPLLDARVRSLEEKEAPPPEGVQWWTLDCEGSAVHFGGVANFGHLLGADVLRISPKDESTLVKEVGSRCFSDLCSSLWGGAAVELTPVVSLDQIELDERYGGLVGVVEGLPADLWVLATRAWCDQFGLERAARRVPLTDRQEALKTTRVTVAARIELGAIPLADSLGWAEGEMLVTDASRHSPVTLQVMDQFVLTGTLTESQGVRVVTVA